MVVRQVVRSGLHSSAAPRWLRLLVAMACRCVGSRAGSPPVRRALRGCKLSTMLACLPVATAHHTGQRSRRKARSSVLGAMLSSARSTSPSGLNLLACVTLCLRGFRCSARQKFMFFQVTIAVTSSPALAMCPHNPQTRLSMYVDHRSCPILCNWIESGGAQRSDVPFCPLLCGASVDVEHPPELLGL